MDDANEDLDNICPLCMEEMDVTDRHLKPCQCGYQICVWCWHQVIELAGRENTEGRCPACRTPYDKDKVVGTRLSASELEFTVDKRKAHKSKKQEGRKHLSNVRVVQRNLVYIVGFPVHLADEESLEKREYFGQYGKILKVAVSKQNSHNGPSASVYVTFVREEDAVKCIKAIDGCIFEGKLLRACFGTNKYCNAWLKNMPCNNPECLYLHDEGPDEDSYTKEEMITNKNQFHDLTRPPHRAVGVLPPPFVEASSSVSLISQPQPTSTPSKVSVQKSVTTPTGKVTSLPPAAAWGMRAAASKSVPATKVQVPSVKKKPGGVEILKVDAPLKDAEELEVLTASEPEDYTFFRDAEHKADVQTDFSQGSSSPDNHGYGAVAEFMRPPSGYDEGSSSDGQVLNVGDVSINLNCETTMVRSEPTSPQPAEQSPTASEDVLSALALDRIDLGRESSCDAGPSSHAWPVDLAESNIIEDILSLEFNPEEGLSTDDLSKLLQRPGRQFEESPLPIRPKQQSRFSFARQGVASSSNHHSEDQGFTSRDVLTRSMSLHSSGSDGHLKSRLFAPPGFAGTSVPPPGFSVRASSVPPSPAGNRVQEFDLIDPAIMAVGRPELARLRPIQTKVDTRQLHDTDTLLGLELMQQQQQQQQQAGFMDFGNLIKHQLPHQQARKVPPLKYPMDEFSSILHSDVGPLARLSGQYDNSNYISPYSPGSARNYRSLENGWAGYGAESLAKFKRGLGGNAIAGSLRPGEGNMFYSNGNQSLSGLDHYMSEADIQGAFV